MAKNKLKSFKDVAFITSVIYIVLGLLLAVFKGNVISWAMTVAGVLLIIFGVLGIVKGKTLYGVIGLVIGILIVVCGWTIVDIAITVLGVLVAVKGVVDLIEALKVKKNTLPIVYAALTILAGVLLAVAKWLVFDWFFIVVGVLLIVDGIFGLLGKKIF